MWSSPNNGTLGSYLKDVKQPYVKQPAAVVAGEDASRVTLGGHAASIGRRPGRYMNGRLMS